MNGQYEILSSTVDSSLSSRVTGSAFRLPRHDHHVTLAHAFGGSRRRLGLGQGLRSSKANFDFLLVIMCMKLFMSKRQSREAATEAWRITRARQ